MTGAASRAQLIWNFGAGPAHTIRCTCMLSSCSIVSVLGCSALDSGKRVAEEGTPFALVPRRFRQEPGICTGCKQPRDPDSNGLVQEHIGSGAGRKR